MKKLRDELSEYLTPDIIYTAVLGVMSLGVFIGLKSVEMQAVKYAMGIQALFLYSFVISVFKMGREIRRIGDDVLAPKTINDTVYGDAYFWVTLGLCLMVFLGLSLHPAVDLDSRRQLEFMFTATGGALMGYSLTSMFYRFIARLNGWRPSFWRGYNIEMLYVLFIVVIGYVGLGLSHVAAKALFFVSANAAIPYFFLTLERYQHSPYVLRIGHVGPTKYITASLLLCISAISVTVYMVMMPESRAIGLVEVFTGIFIGNIVREQLWGRMRTEKKMQFPAK